MLNKLRGLMEIREGMEKEVINDIINMLDENASDDEVQSLLEEIQEHGCSSGVVPSMIYYSYKEKFFDKYSNEIFELYNDFKEETGYTLSTIDKNSLAWFSYELIVSNLYDEIVEHEDLFAAYR